MCVCKSLPSKHSNQHRPEFSPIFLPSGGVILYAGSSGSASPSPGSPSSGYQTQSPSSHSQPSSPEGVSFQEIGSLKQRGERGGGTSSPKMVFQFPEVNNAPVAPITTVSSANYNHPTVAKRPCGFTGTFTSKYPLYPPFLSFTRLPDSSCCTSVSDDGRFFHRDRRYGAFV